MQVDQGWLNKEMGNRSLQAALVKIPVMYNESKDRVSQAGRLHRVRQVDRPFDSFGTNEMK